MKRVRQFFACYLALCFGFAGAVGLSPVLHRLIEHGNQGPAHTHHPGTGRAREQAHPIAHASPAPHPHPHFHRHPPAEARPALTGRGFVYEHEFKLPTIALGRLWHSLIHFLAGDLDDSSPSSPDNPAHHHDSLPQLLASGLVETVLDTTSLGTVPARVISIFFPPDLAPVTRDWDAQSASRAPPSSRS